MYPSSPTLTPLAPLPLSFRHCVVFASLVVFPHSERVPCVGKLFTEQGLKFPIRGEYLFGIVAFVKLPAQVRAEAIPAPEGFVFHGVARGPLDWKSTRLNSSH